MARMSGEYRVWRTHTFAYGVVYRIDEGVAVVNGIVHLHRGPEFWERRFP